MPRRAARQTPSAFRGTQVAAHKSREDIEIRLVNAGAEAVQWQSVRDATAAQMLLRFKFRGRVYRFRLPLFDAEAQTEEARRRDERQRLRALHWSIKAMLDAEDFGMLKFEDLALAFAEVALPEAGQTITVGEVINAQLDAARLPDLTASLRALSGRTTS